MAPAGFVPLPRWRVIAGAAVLLTVVAALTLLAWPRSDRAEANPISGLVDISAGAAHTCGLTGDGGVLCWGSNRNGQLGDGTRSDRSVPTAVSGLSSGVAQVDAGEAYTCALTTDGGVQCWGSFGGLGVASTVPMDIPVPANNVVAIASGSKDLCALRTSGEVVCWHTYDPVAFTVIDGLEDVASIVHGGTFGCALTMGGAVQCWGELLSPTAVAVTERAAAVAAGSRHVCVLLHDGSVTCWGDNGQGQLGDGTTADRDGPAAVQGLLRDVVGLSAGGSRTCALLDDGSVVCWGAPYGAAPVQIDGVGDVVQLAVGVDHACARSTSGAVKCWGSNGSGQLGDGTDRSSAVPVEVVVSEPKPPPPPTACPEQGCPTPTPSPDCDADACMALAIEDDAGTVLCHSAGDAACDLPVGSSFTLAVDAFAPPGNGYIFMQTFINYGEHLTRHPSPSASDEVVWPDEGFSLRRDRDHGLVLHGAETGLIPPVPVSHYAGNVVAFSMTCSPGDSLTEVRLLPEGDPVAQTNGALFVAVKDGVLVQIVPDVGSLSVACCDETISSTDASLILQMTAGLIGGMPCDFQPDVNQDGSVSSIDALFVLQFVAGMLSALPPPT